MQRFEVPKGFFGARARRSSRTAACSPTSAGRRPASSRSRRRPARSCGPRPTPAPAIRRRSARRSPGRRYAIFLTRAGLVGPRSGDRDRCCFSGPGARGWLRRSTRPRPLVVGDLIFVSAQYGPGAGVLRARGFDADVALWTSDDALSNHYATSVHRDGILYGFHGRQEFGQSFRAVELRTGKVRWSQERFGAGTVTLAGDRLVILRENGELVLAPASPDGFKPLARAQILPGVVRAYPALSDGFLFARNDNTLDLAGPATTIDAVAALALLPPCCSSGAGATGDSRSRRRRFRGRPRRRIGRGIRRAGEARAVGRRPSSGSAGSRCTTPGGTRTAARSSNRIARSTRTTSRTRRGTSSASRAPNRPTRPGRRFFPSAPTRACRCGRSTRCFAALCRPTWCCGAAGSRDLAQFYAHLYVGLYYEALRDRRRALEHLTMAAADRYAEAGGYMHTVARVHLLVNR